MSVELIRWYDWLWLWAIPTRYFIDGDCTVGIKRFRGHLYMVSESWNTRASGEVKHER